jgi:hypothetical protein
VRRLGTRQPWVRPSALHIKNRILEELKNGRKRGVKTLPVIMSGGSGTRSALENMRSVTFGASRGAITQVSRVSRAHLPKPTSTREDS